MKLRSRLALAAAFLLAVLAVVGVLLPRSVESAEVDQVDHQLYASLPIARGLAGAPFTGSRAQADGPAALGGIYVARMEPTGRLVAVQPSSVGGREPNAPPTLSDITSVAPVTVGSTKGSGSWRAVMIQPPDGSQVIIAVSLDSVDATMRQLILAEMVAAAAVLSAMVAAGWWLMRLGLHPIAEVTAVADAIAAGDRSRRVVGSSGGTETAHLARAFNVMLNEQEAAEAKLRQFVADASHELRNPVAAIGGLVDLWRQGGIEMSDVDDVMRRLGQESSRMRRLVEDLLLLARFDEKPALAVESADISELAADVAVSVAGTYPSRSVVVDAPSPVMVYCDATRIRQVITNLVINGIVHTSAPATVTVRVRLVGDQSSITVVDSGEGMTEEEAARAFDRFWRADAGRSQGGTGLGLAIVRSIVEAHGGQVSLASHPGSGSEVRIALPRSTGVQA